MVGVHRAAWILANGPVPAGLVVRHRCDIPRCVRVDHLELGTVADNNRDRDTRGRFRVLRGSSNGMAKLTEEKVADIRKRLGAGEKQAVLAREMGVHKSLISLIHTGKTWK